MKSLEGRITSLRAITTPMLIVNGALTALLTSLLLEVLEVNNIVLQYIASFGLAIGIGWTVLNTSVNSYLIKKYIPVLFAIGTLVLMLIKLKVFEPLDKHYSWYLTRIFLSLIGAATEYTFSHLFIKKYHETNEAKEKKLQKQKLIKDIADLERDISDLKQTLSSNEQERSHAQRILSELHQKIREANAMLKETTCPKCDQIFGSKNALNAHIGKCKIEKTTTNIERTKLE